MLYEVVFYMQTPVVISDPLHFDALLMAVHPGAVCVTEVNRNLRDDSLVQLELPLAKAVCGNSWIWGASSIELDDNAVPYRGNYKKSICPDDANYLQKNVMTIGGLHKDRINLVSGYVSKTVSFLAESDDPTRLEMFCGRISNIGKLRGMGYGMVRDFDIKPTGKSWKTCLVQDGRAMRNLPMRFVKGAVNEQIIALPPYWGAYRREPGVSPGNAAILAEGVHLC